MKIKVDDDKTLFVNGKEVDNKPLKVFLSLMAISAVSLLVTLIVFSFLPLATMMFSDLSGGGVFVIASLFVLLMPIVFLVLLPATFFHGLGRVFSK
ncbi:hypothetical protein MHO82_00750 [Vibrio sp. Of7-15]|uniref:hypothetical protein n=1 Tax=Vibrio sp. Of7-15 TaxID=2724879 RepID=UPI001EF2BE13|nr:hypothetical protein [Vibrio sp. Of7-15]MCG7495387.1 hypothetical protein [Vibrio sp. Of7-15]